MVGRQKIKLKLSPIFLAIILVLSLALGLQVIVLAESGGSISWSSVSSGTYKNLHAVTYGNSIFVTVGDAGTVLTSSDGTRWSRQSSGTDNNLNGITYGGKMFVAVGDNGTILTSSDGVNWSSQISGFSRSLFTENNRDIFVNLTSVVFGNNIFIAVGSFQSIETSSDGIHWSKQTISYGIEAGIGEPRTLPHNGTTVRSICYGNNMFVASISDDNMHLGAFSLYSPDGLTWYSCDYTLSAYPYFGVAFYNNKYYMVGSNGDIMSSSDGNNWTSLFAKVISTNVISVLTFTGPTESSLYEVANINNQIFAVGQDGAIVSSSDGSQWALQTSGTKNSLYGVAYGNSIYVIVGAKGTILTNSSYATATPNSSSVLVNGKSVGFQAYTINSNNYFKLRDLAMALNGTGKQFNVGWDGTNNAISITSNTAYTPVGGELSNSGGSSSVSASASTSNVYLDGKQVILTAYTINGNNYFKLRDFGQALNFGVTWDGSANMIKIDTSTGYSA